MIKKINSDGTHILVICPNPSIDVYAELETVEFGVPNRISHEVRYPGGKGVHVAMALSELGHHVALLGFWGGQAGEWIKSTVKHYYPSVEFYGSDLKEWTRSCYTFKSSGEFNDTEILGPGPSITNQDYEHLLESTSELIKNAQMTVMCGSWPKGSPENGYADLIRISSDHQIPAFIDCTGIQLENALREKPFGIHLNRKEITSFFDLDFDKSKMEILNHCQVAAVTDGSKGLYYLSNNTEHHALSPIEEVISTIGSGDCLTAGVVSGLVQSLDDSSIARLGAACGAANCIREELGMMFKRDVERLLQP